MKAHGINVCAPPGGGWRDREPPSVRRRSAGRTRRPGVRIGIRMGTVGERDPHIIEVYAFEIGGKILSVLLFCRESNREAAFRAFRRIGSSLRGSESGYTAPP